MDSRQHLAHLIAADHPGPYREDLRTITGTRSDQEYQQVRGRRFTAEETVAVDAAADYLVAQVAGQEQAGGGSSRDDSFVNLLRQRLAAGRGKVSP